MFHLIYTSKERPECKPLNLKTILVGARMRNSRLGVTGILIHHEETFLQVLEGQETSVRKLFDRISKDGRHQNITVLTSATTVGQRRQFGDWSMAFHDATGTAHLLTGFKARKNNFALTSLDEIGAMILLKEYVINDIKRIA